MPYDKFRDMASVVYKIEIAGKYQIGSTGNLYRRIYNHLYALKKGNHANLKMQNRYNKHNDFSYMVLFEFENREDAYVKEQELLDIYFGQEKYLMCNPKASQPPIFYGEHNHMFGNGYKLSGEKNGMYGKNHTETSIKKIKDAFNEDRLTLYSERFSGDKNPSKKSDVRKKISESRLGDKNVMKRQDVKDKMIESCKKTRALKKLNGIPNYKTVYCPYCGKLGSANNMSRYHFENCKNKK
jgi:hypothetical protein